MSDLGRLRRLQSSSALCLFILFILTIGATRANAVPFNFSFSGPGISASGTFDITSPAAGFPSCSILSCIGTVDAITSGTFNGNTMTLITTPLLVCNDGSSPCIGPFTPGHSPYDNSAEVSNNSFLPDGDGVGFSAGGVNYDLNSDPQVCSATGCTSLTSYSAVAATATPLPAALPLFATGLGGLGLLGWRRRRKTIATA
jgi:hypothetical protein